MDVSDKFKIDICKNCGMIAIVNNDEEFEIYKCNNCDGYTTFKSIHIPYACKLLFKNYKV